MTTPHVLRHTNLALACFTPQQHERSCDYWYAVRTGMTPHTAFTTSEKLYEWLQAHGLTLARPVPNEWGTHDWIPIVGEYRSVMHWERGDFDAVEQVAYFPVVSNGEYTLGKITINETGMRTVHFMNPNTRDGLLPWPRRYDHSVERPFRTRVEERRALVDYIATL